MKVSFGVFPFGVGVYGISVPAGYDKGKGFRGYFRVFVNGFVKGLNMPEGAAPRPPGLIVGIPDEVLVIWVEQPSVKV